MRNKKLEVRDLRISFRTANGKVQAVRGINFDVYEGETLAVVGESGSGKSVTARAIMGLLAPNAILENGEILYDGNDLTKFSERDFQQIRGDKIAMIFQDPLSSLTPIVKVGKQITETMVLKSRVSRKRFRKELTAAFKELNKTLGGKEFAALSEKYKKAELCGGNFERKYVDARDAALETEEKIEALLLAFGKKDNKTVISGVKGILKEVKRAIHPDLLEKEEIAAFTNALSQFTDVEENLGKLSSVIKNALGKAKPDYEARGFALMFSAEKDLTDEAARALFEAHARKDFRHGVRKAVFDSRQKSISAKKAALTQLNRALTVFGSTDFSKKEAEALAKSLSDAVKQAIDPLDTRKNNDEWTFGTSLKNLVSRYFSGAVKNKAEEGRYRSECEKLERAKGKQVSGTPVPAALTDLELIRTNIVKLITKRIEENEAEIAAEYDFDAAAERFIAFLNHAAYGSVEKVTERMAKRKALKLMEEVGIPDAAKRYNQYPFELSGGQRQRIVIAIALSANPDVLICDEPTTALDVTIQAQILSLINRIKRERKLSIIFITHDLGVVANMANRVAIMYAGKIVEYGTVREVFYQPAHPYTWALLLSMPDLDSKDELEAIRGTPANMIYPPPGDAFAERNKYALAIDFKKEPPMFQITETHYAATWLLHPYAPKVEIPAAITARIERMKQKEQS